jgi:hypothetical protein
MVKSMIYPAIPRNWQFQGGRIIAPFFGTKCADHIFGVEKAPVQANQTNLAIGASTILAGITTNSGFECWRIPLKGIQGNPVYVQSS